MKHFCLQPISPTRRHRWSCDHAFEWMELPVTPMLNPETRIRMNIPPMDAVMFTLSEPGEPAV